MSQLKLRIWTIQQQNAAAVLIAFSHWVFTLNAAPAILSMSVPGETNISQCYHQLLFCVEN